MNVFSTLKKIRNRNPAKKRKEINQNCKQIRIDVKTLGIHFTNLYFPHFHVYFCFVILSFAMLLYVFFVMYVYDCMSFM